MMNQLGIAVMPQLPELEKIRKMREQLELSQRELATLAGVSQSLIAKIERGGIDPSYGNVKRIFEALERVINQRKIDGKSVGARITAGDLSTKGVVSISPDDTISEAVDRMVAGRFTQLPVMSGDRVVGSITDDRIRDYTIEEARRGERPYEAVMMTRVEEIMEAPFPIMSEDTPIELASVHLQFDEAILVSKRGAVVGILTSADFLKLGLRR